MPTLTSQAWCRGCGATGAADAPGTGDGPRCGSCDTPMNPPELGPDRIGRVVDTGARLRTVLGIALSEDGNGVTMAVKGDQPVVLSTAEFDLLKRVAIPGAPVWGSAGRLWAALLAVSRGSLRAKWTGAMIDAAAQRQALATIGTRRAAALDRIALGLPDGLGELGLSATELAWYQAWMAGTTGDVSTLLDHMERLPREGYGERVHLLLTRTADLLRDPALAERASAQLAPFADGSPDATALLAALSAAPPEDIVDAFAAYLARVDLQPGRESEEFAALDSVVVRLASDQTPGSWDGQPAAGALAHFLAGRRGIPLDGQVGAIAGLPVVLLDELIEAGALTAAAAGHRAWRPADAAYLHCRLDPAGASDADLAAVGFTPEIARRAYLAGDSSTLAALPADDPDVRHYRALASWTDDSGACELDGLRAPHRRQLELVAGVRDRIAEAADGAELPEALAADSTCWPLLRAQAAAGSLFLTEQVQADHPDCLHWLDLCRVEQLVYAGRWSEAVSSGTALAERAGRPAVRSEALNLAALAEFELSGGSAALRVLEPALDGQCETALLVNAAVLAAQQGSEPALPYLGLIARRTGDGRMRRAAVSHAVHLWLGDPDSADYPALLRDAVRGALAIPLDGPLHWDLLRLTNAQDTGWLAGSGGDTVAASGPVQVAAVRYWRTRAGSLTDGRPETLVDVAALLCSLAAATDPPGWVQSEISWLVELLDDGVHRAFGEPEAVFCIPVIEELLRHNVLTPPYRVIFAVQAGAHRAAFDKEHGDCLPAGVEQRLLFEPCNAFLRGDPPLEDGEKTFVAKEIGRCLGISAHSLMAVIDQAFESSSPEWSRLLNHRRATPRENYAMHNTITRQLAGILDRLETLVTRLRAYQRSLGQLPPEAVEGDTRVLLAELISDWSSEIARLREFV